MEPRGFDSINWGEFFTSVIVTAGVGMLRFLSLVRRGRQVRWVDAVFEPAIAVFAGMLVWGINEFAGMPDVMQAVLTSLGAWGGPHTIQMLEKKHFGETSSQQEERSDGPGPT